MATPPRKVRLRESVLALPAYVPGARPQGAMVEKLSSNENPFPPLPGVLTAVTDAAADLNRYPDMATSELIAALADLNEVEPDQIVVGNGSTAVLETILRALCQEGDEVVHAWRSFEAYPIAVAVTGATSVPVPLTSEGRHDVDAMLAAVTDRTRAILLCTPNNPTGPVLTQAEVERVLAEAPSDVLVLLDEAYVEFVRVPTVDGLAAQASHDNVVILRTFSKAYGLAGLRVGYAIGDPTIIGAASLAGIPLSVTGLATSAAIASIEAEGELLARVEQLADDRDALQRRLADEGLSVPEAHGNFLWVAATPQQAGPIAEILESVRIVARQFPDGVRITVAEREAHDGIVEAIRRIRELA